MVQVIKQKDKEIHDLAKGEREMYRFKNDYIAEVLRLELNGVEYTKGYSEGKYELRILKFMNEVGQEDMTDACIIVEVLEGLTKEQIKHKLKEIEKWK